MLEMDSRVASGLSSSETTPDPTYYSHKHTTNHFIFRSDQSLKL